MLPSERQVIDRRKAETMPDIESCIRPDLLEGSDIVRQLLYEVFGYSIIRGLSLSVRPSVRPDEGKAATEVPTSVKLERVIVGVEPLDMHRRLLAWVVSFKLVENVCIERPQWDITIKVDTVTANISDLSDDVRRKSVAHSQVPLLHVRTRKIRIGILIAASRAVSSCEIQPKRG